MRPAQCSRRLRRSSCRCAAPVADSRSMSYTAASAGPDTRPSAPIASRRPRPSGRKNAHRGLAACRRAASSKTCSQALTASGKTRHSPTTARRTSLLPQTTSCSDPYVCLPPPQTCMGSARVLQGNPNTIGSPGGFSGPSAGNILVTSNGAAVIPSQWGGKGALRPYLGQISGTLPAYGVSFQGVVDTIGSTTVPNVQSFLMNTYPGQLILELPGASQDYGTTGVQLSIPGAMSCPAGTTGSP
jgi:hypothetical protein